jgi:hypothetical protein
MQDPTTGRSPQKNCDTFWMSFLTIMTIMTGDGWQDVMYEGMQLGGMYEIAAPVLFIIVLVPPFPVGGGGWEWGGR